MMLMTERKDRKIMNEVWKEGRKKKISRTGIKCL